VNGPAESDDAIAARLWASVAKLAAARTGPATVRRIDVLAGGPRSH
jgi:hypothetical protein